MPPLIPPLDAVPLVGIGPVRLGMTRDAVRALGPYRTFEKVPGTYVDTVLDDGVQVYYDAQGFVEFVQATPRVANRIRFDGKLVLQLPADQAVAHVASKAPLEADPSSPGYAYVFPTIETSLWRPVTNDRTFRTLGLGRPGYYSNMPRRPPPPWKKPDDDEPTTGVLVFRERAASVVVLNALGVLCVVSGVYLLISAPVLAPLVVMSFVPATIGSFVWAMAKRRRLRTLRLGPGFIALDDRTFDLGTTAVALLPPNTGKAVFAAAAVVGALAHVVPPGVRSGWLMILDGPDGALELELDAFQNSDDVLELLRWAIPPRNGA